MERNLISKICVSLEKGLIATYSFSDDEYKFIDNISYADGNLATHSYDCYLIYIAYKINK